ncbi:DUF4209 domain-containing protein [Marinitoga aeolica]|uniref:DUF4209 domain-containing protein n=1 Tax=Marinitoga aeolica TaxID=2809031 RepID=A0ABY8PMR5_9BACT|nr:DUF4209 domain-containing protein [Marinitoga aeolica]WGS63937.1 DUF4209 domain-containing protein [Marinitoga aeolica]
MDKEHKNKEIKKFLYELDAISEKISEYEISQKIKSFIKNEFEKDPPEILIWEQIAFDLIENCNDNKMCWDTYFGPFSVWSNEKGEMFEYPSIQKLSSEIIIYWEKRAKESKHPILRARYSNLVWDFSSIITGKKPDYSIAQIFVDSVVEIMEKDLHKYTIDVIKNKAKRALSIALSINDKKLINILIDTIINYEEKISEDDKPGLWGFSYELLIKNKNIKLSKDKKQIIIERLEERFKRLLMRNDYWAVKRAVVLLVDYYSRHQKKEKTKEILINFEKVIQRLSGQISFFTKSFFLEELYHFYIKYGLKKEADRISFEIKKIGKNVVSELKTIEASIKISNEEIKKFIDNIIVNDLRNSLKKVALYYIPKKEEIKTQLRELSQEAPLTYLFSRKIIDREGRVICSVGSLEEDMDGHISLQISQNMGIDAFLLNETINTLIKKFDLDVKKIVDYFYESPIFDEKRREFFIQGIEAYLNKEFIKALHILIPQIEAIIRNLAELIGIPVLKTSSSDGFNYKTLDGLLRENRAIGILTEDMSLYLRVLLTDPRGWNLRNNMCHGISNVEDFNQISADRIFHALLCLALVKEEK